MDTDCDNGSGLGRSPIAPGAVAASVAQTDLLAMDGRTICDRPLRSVPASMVDSRLANAAAAGLEHECAIPAGLPHWCYCLHRRGLVSWDVRRQRRPNRTVTAILDLSVVAHPGAK